MVWSFYIQRIFGILASSFLFFCLFLFLILVLVLVHVLVYDHVLVLSSVPISTNANLKKTNALQRVPVVAWENLVGSRKNYGKLIFNYFSYFFYFFKLTKHSYSMILKTKIYSCFWRKYLSTLLRSLHKYIHYDQGNQKIS